jgi:polyisoprenoid-binding protein YceI
MRLLALFLCSALAACAVVPGAPDRGAPFVQRGAVEAPRADGQVSAPVDLPAGAYRLDPNHASVLFRIRHMDLAWFTGRFDTIAATLTLDAADPTLSELTASVGAASVNTGVLTAGGERHFDGVIARALGAPANAEIVLRSTRIERTGANDAVVTADLTLNGQTLPVTLNVTFDGARTDVLRGGAMVLGFSAHGLIDRTQWGVTQWREFTGEDVQIIIEAELVKA